MLLEPGFLRTWYWCPWCFMFSALSEPYYRECDEDKGLVIVNCFNGQVPIAITMVSIIPIIMATISVSYVQQLCKASSNSCAIIHSFSSAYEDSTTTYYIV